MTIKLIILIQIYTSVRVLLGNPAAMLESYLSVVTKGTCNGEENGMFSTKDYDIRQAYAAGSIKGSNQLLTFLKNHIFCVPILWIFVVTYQLHPL